jgi:hypothetical protein
MRSILVALLLVCAAATQANAQFAPASGGETSAFVKCFYECKEGPLVQGMPTFQEITTHMIANESPADRFADIYYFNGREECVAHSDLELSSVDLDELNVCHSLLLGGVPPPPAGLIEIIVRTGPGPADPLADGVYAWGKNVLGKFRYDNPEPFEGRVTGIGKYECRLVPYDVGMEQAVTNKCPVPPYEVLPILVEETDDPPACACNPDLNGDGIVGVPDQLILSGCIGLPPSGSCAAADLNCDGVIDAADQAILECSFGGPPNPACCP